MDAIVARYSRPVHDNERVTEDLDDELLDPVAHGIALKFAMPPVAHVSRQTLGRSRLRRVAGI